ncbi:MAG: UPF0104 family protein [Parafilimonas terrae]|nr:UPF0104 family protein [Parafilimonas terrae]
MTFVWPAIGLGAVVFSLWLLVRELRGLSWAEVEAAFANISAARWLLAIGSTLVAYTALAWYDRIALFHLGFKLSWTFISAVSFTTYALSHNIGMSMFSGAMVRYRAYSTKGLTVADVGILVAFCSFTFALGTIMLGGIVLLVEPQIVLRLFSIDITVSRLLGAAMLLVVALYVGGSALHLPPLTIGKFKLVYPRLPITMRQLLAGPLELMGAAGIIYAALPAEYNPGFLIVLGIFLASFSAALLSHAPGGLGVLEVVFVTALPDMPRADVVAALLVFRLLYLIAPLLLGIVAVVLFERSRIVKAPALE